MYSRVVHGKNTRPRAGQIQVLNARFTQFVKIHKRMMPRRGDSIMMNKNKQPTSYVAPFGEDGSPKRKVARVCGNHNDATNSIEVSVAVR